VARSFSVDWVFARFATISRRSRLHWRLPIWRAAIGAAEQGKSSVRCTKPEVAAGLTSRHLQSGAEEESNDGACEHV
jgi:hypothetical protein